MGGTFAGWNFRWVEFYVGGMLRGWNFRWVEFSWVEFSWVKFSWVEFSWVEFSWNPLVEMASELKILAGIFDSKSDFERQVRSIADSASVSLFLF